MSDYDKYAPMAAKWLLPGGTITDKMPTEGGGGEVEDGSITTSKFAPDAKAPFSGQSDSTNSVAWGSVTGKPALYTKAEVDGLISGLQQQIDSLGGEPGA